MSAKLTRMREENKGLHILRFLQAGEAKCCLAGKQRLVCENRRGSITVSLRRLAELADANLILRVSDRIALTEAGHAHLTRHSVASEPFLMQHGGVVARERARNDPITRFSSTRRRVRWRGLPVDAGRAVSR